MCFRYLNSGLRFLVTLVLILALAFFTCGVFIVFCRKCDDKVCTTIKFLTTTSKISLPQTLENITPTDKGKYLSPRQRTRHCVRHYCTWTRAPTWVSSEPSPSPPTQVSRVSCRTDLFCPEDSRKVTEAPTRGAQIGGKEAWEQVEVRLVLVDKFK